MRTRIIALMLLTLLLAGCEMREVVTSIDIPEVSPYLTLTCFLEPGADTVLLHVGRSYPAQTRNYHDSVYNGILMSHGCIPGARVEVMDMTSGWQVQPQISEKHGLYFFKGAELPIVEGHQYRVTVDYRPYPQVGAECVVPEFPNAHFTYGDTPKGVYAHIESLGVAFRPRVSVAFSTISRQVSGTPSHSYYTDTYSSDEVGLEFLYRYDYPDQLFTDDPGKKPQAQEVDSMRLYLVDEEGFKYLSQLHTAKRSLDLFQNNPVSDYTNVEHGRGILASYKVLAGRRKR